MEYTQEFCQVDFCTRKTVSPVKKSTFCGYHHKNYERTGDPLNGDFDAIPNGCTVEDCDRKHLRRGLCSPHYYRLRNTGSLFPKYKSSICSVEGCDRSRKSMGLCNTHYMRFKKTGDAGSAEIKSHDIKPCAVPHCRKNGGLSDSVLCRQHRQLANNYSLSEERYIEMMSVPCAVCGSDDGLVVDHDHACCPSKTSCGECVRGTLCGRCNKVLGSVYDSSELLEGLIRYLS